MPSLNRRHFLGGLAATAALSACSSGSSGSPSAGSTTGSHGMHMSGTDLPTATPLAPTAGQRVVTAKLTPRPVTLDLGGVRAKTWAYGETAPGTPIRAKAGDLLRITVDNQLPTDTSVHWHGIRLRNVADGVPGVTQAPIAAGASYRYEFVVPDPGTYFFHPHTGVQLDRGLYAPLIVDDPAEKGRYDAEWIVVLDDWTDGVGKSPDDILAAFKAQNGTVSPGMNMGGMDHGSMMSGSPLGDAGDILYPHYLVNGRIPAAPTVFTAKPRQKVRIRFINAASDTIFRVALAGHTMSVTHTDGYPVVPAQASALYIAMGERYDVVVTLGDGVFPLVAAAEGKKALARALVRTSSGAAPSASLRPSELNGTVLFGAQLTPDDSARLPAKDPDDTVTVELNGQMKPYAWGMNGTTYGHDSPIMVTEGQRVRLRMTNMTMMSHPMHLHGHTWAVAGTGVRKDTILIAPMQTIQADLHADNPGAWAYHCHNAYHGELGMMTTLRYR